MISPRREVSPKGSVKNLAESSQSHLKSSLEYVFDELGAYSRIRYPPHRTGVRVPAMCNEEGGCYFMPGHRTAVNESAPFVYEFGPFRLNLQEQLLSREGEAVPLTPKVFDVLVVLVKSHGQVVRKDQLMQSVWPDSFVEESNLTQNISVLRHVLGERSNHKKYIETLPKRGYRFVVPVREVRTEPSATVGAPKAASDLPRQLRRRGSAWIWLAALIALAASVGIITAWFWAPHPGFGPGLAPRVLPFTSSPGSENDPAFSPDARHVAFSWDGGGGNRDIYVKPIGAETPLRLTTHPGSDRWPVWSPDGSQIAFARRSPEASGIYTVPALGGTERKLLSVTWESEPLAKLDWSPDGKQIAFSEKCSPTDAASIYLLSLDDFTRRRLTSPAERYVGNPPAAALGDLSPAFSPDGRSVAFIRRSASVSSDIYLVSVSGGKPTRLTFDNRAVYGLAWTPQGRNLVFSSWRGGQLSLWRVSASGGSPERLSFGEDATQLTIARRQDRLAYACINRQRLSIWMIEASSFGSRSAGRCSRCARTRRRRV
jgi:Tol biopolymer transport system component/DNA-binding winged helix-turn-helix (wHTH) protein